MRTFIAIPISDELKHRAETVKAQLLPVDADVKWVQAENYHLTLKFIGEVGEDELANIIKTLQRASEESLPFVLKPRGAGFFPNSRRPRVLWIGVGGEMDKAVWLGERVDVYLAELGYEPEKNRKFHLTLGRIRSDKNVQELVEAVEQTAGRVDFPPFKVSEIRLMKSQLSREGPQYSVIETFQLGAGL